MNIKRYEDFKSWLLLEADETDETESSDDVTFDEPYNENPESYIKDALVKLKRKVETFFDEEQDSLDDDMSDPNDIIGPEGFDDRSQRDKTSKKEKLTLKEMGAKLESSDIGNGSKTHKSMTIKFSVGDYYYSMHVRVSLKEAIDLIDKGEELSDESIQKSFIKMKKISLDDFEELASNNQNVMLGNIDEKFIIGMKIDLDGETTDGSEENLEIEV